MKWQSKVNSPSKSLNLSGNAVYHLTWNHSSFNKHRSIDDDINEHFEYKMKSAKFVYDKKQELLKN